MTTNHEPTPEFLPQQQITLNGLRERVEAAFHAEVGARVELLQEGEAERRELLRNVIDYVLATGSITLSRAERLTLTEQVWRDLFELGPLVSLLDDPTLTEIELRSAREITLQRGGQKSVSDVVFENAYQLEQVVRNIAMTAGVDPQRESFVEVGVTLAGRPARLTVVGPPISPQVQATFRIHPAMPLPLNGAPDFIDPAALALLQGYLSQGRGMMIAGDAGAGKTTLIQGLLPALHSDSSAASIALVQRADEIRTEVAVTRYTADQRTAFAQQIAAAVESAPSWLVLDEVRFDESAQMWAALIDDHNPRCLWAFRGSTDPLRLRTAFGMAVRRAMQGIEQQFITGALLTRLPLVVYLGKRAGKPCVTRISEWVAVPDDPASVTSEQRWALQS